MTREKCKEVLQALWRYKDCGYSENEIRESLDMAIKALEQELSVTPARNKGKWIPHRAKYDNAVPVYECSICHKYNGFENTNYCPHCGCFMSEGD